MKILVTGPTQVGKSTFVSKVTGGNCLKLERNGVTIAMDFGIVVKKDVRVRIFGTPGLERFRLVRKVLAQGADGVLFMIDGTNINETRTRRIWQEVTQYLSGVPCIVAINKIDLISSLNILEIRKKLEFITGIPTIPISALKGENVSRVLNILILVIISMNPLLARLMKYQNVPNSFKNIMTELDIPLSDLKAYLRWLELRNLIRIDWKNEKISLSSLVIESIRNPGKVLEE